jgi:hypothetical protein
MIKYLWIFLAVLLGTFLGNVAYMLLLMHIMQSQGAGF